MQAIGTRRSPVEMLAEDFARRLRAGEQPDVADYVERCPAYADEIRELFPLIAALETTKTGASPSDPEGTDDDRPSLMKFGDHHILREVGRGGMGVVYEAKQQSLDRRVALKVLPLNYLPTPKHIVRFKREAQSAARLHHTNIVPVFGVGEQDGNHYYVMQFIDGVSFDAVIEALRDLCDECEDERESETPSPDAPERNPTAIEFARLLVTSKLGNWSLNAQQSKQPGRTKSGDGSSAEHHARRFSDYFVEAQGIRAESYYWRNIARIGLGVADALQHAHDQGVLHRDIKPSNLMIDHEGTPWITDFGLAKVTGHETVTASQDTVGTLRYMAPEQIRGEFDARSEIYNLGLTLYELATLQPAFSEIEHSRLIQKVIESPPPRPRSINPGIPRKLETIILKAIAKERKDRYQSARQLADDLGRFLSGSPLYAKRATPIAGLLRWCDRNAATVRLASIVVILLLIIPAIASINYIHSTNARAASQTELEDVQRALTTALKAREAAEDRAKEAHDRIDLLEGELRQIPSSGGAPRRAR